jgi:hypothetical protein
MFEIQQANEKLFEQLFLIFKEEYPNNPRLQEPDYLKWQFAQNPCYKGDGYNFWVAKKDGIFCGFWGGIAVDYKIDGKIHNGCELINFHGNLLENFHCGLQLLSHFGNIFDYRGYKDITPQAQDLYRKLRVPMLKKLPRLAFVVNPEICSDLFETSLKDLKQLQAKSDKTLGENISSTVISEINKFDPSENYDLVWKSAKNSIHYTGAYLNWRYFDIPRHDYKVLAFEKEFVIFREEEIKGTDYKAIRILEWNISPQKIGQAIKMIFEMAGDDLALIDFFCSCREVIDNLKVFGFIEIDEFWENQIPFLFRPTHYRDEITVAYDFPPHFKKREMDYNSSYITKGDGDIDRIKN